MILLFKKIIVSVWLLSGSNVFAQLAFEQDSLIIDSSDFQEVRIDPIYASVAREEELFDSVGYVFLESIKSSEFSTISQLEVTDKHFIIFDHRLQAIYFFYKDGRFDKKILFPKDFGRALGFIIYPSAKQLVVDDIRSTFYFVFDLEGNPMGKIDKVVFGAEIAYSGEYKLQYNSFRITTDMGDARITNYPNLVVVNEKDSSRQEYLWFNPLDSLGYNIYSHKSFYRSSKETGIFIARDLDNIIYRFDRTGLLQRRFKIILPMQNSLPLDFWTNPIYKGKQLEFLSKNRDVSHKISDVYQVGGWLTFRAYFYKPIFYHIASGEYFDYTQMISSSMGLQTTDTRNEIIGVDGNAFITSMSHNWIKRIYDNLPNEERKNFGEEFRKAVTRSYHNPILKLLYVKEP